MTLREKIEHEIRERGSIPFSRYMEICLYDRELGYYARNAEQFGKAGDFYTSSDVHAVFGRLLARQFDEMWRALGSPSSLEVRELGPGRGLFAQDVLDWSEKKFPAFFQALHYRLDEQSSSLREKLQQTLKRHFEAGKASLAPASEMDNKAPSPADDVPTILFANEFFDAFPVEILSDHGSVRISAENGRLVETWVPLTEEELTFLNHYSVRPERGERLEAPLRAQQYMSTMSASLRRGFFVIIDYGYTRAEQTRGTPSRHCDDLPSTLRQPQSLRSPRRAGHHRARELLRARRRR